MLLSFDSQQPPTSLHPRAEVHPHSKLPLPSDVSIPLNASERQPHRITCFHSGMKPSERFSRYWTFLTINLHKMAGQRKELCAHARPSVTFTHMLMEKVVFISRPKVAFSGSQAVEREKKKSGLLKLDSFICSNNKPVQE